MLVKIAGISLHLLSAIRDAALHKLPSIPLTHGIFAPYRLSILPPAILPVTHGLIVESHSQALLKAL